MLIISGKLSDFTSKSRYLNYKKKFLGQCVKSNDLESEEFIVNTNEIVFNDQSFDGEDDYIEYKFRKDYLFPSITRMNSNWEIKFSRKIKTLYTPDLKIGFSRETRNTFREAEKKIKEATYLNLRIKVILVKAIRNFEEFIDSYLKDPLPELKNKIEFNWNKHTLVYFFDLLRKNNIITNMKDSDLGRVIDDRFLFKDDDNYSIPKNSRKLLFALGDKGTKSSKKSYNLLKELFSNPDFYNV